MPHVLLTTALALSTALGGAGAADAAQAAPVAVTTCGQRVTADAYLARDLTCRDGVAVHLDGQGVDLDLRGRALRGTRAGDGVVVTAWQDHTISGGTVQGFRWAVTTRETEDVVPAAGARVRVVDVTVRGSEVGVRMDPGTAEVTGGRVAGNDVGVSTWEGAVTIAGGTVLDGNGVAVSGSVTATHATFTRNDVAAECIDGNLRLSWSRFTHNRQVFGSTRMCPPVLERSYVAHNDLVLRVEHQPSAARVDHNAFHDNGIVLDAVGPVEATGNLFVRNDVAVRSPAFDESTAFWSRVTLTGNTFLHNGDAVHALSAGTLTDNHVEGSTGWGIYAPHVTDGGGNTARRNGNQPQCTGVVCS